MNKINVLVIGYGSAGQKHCDVLTKLVGKKNIFIFSKNLDHQFNKVLSLKPELNTFINYIVISTITSEHLFYLKKVDKIFKNKKVLIEKPLGTKIIKKRFKNNDYFVGYNLRYHPLLLKMKSLLINKKIYNINITCFSFLPSWRSNKNSYSFYKSKGGGVEFDLSHEIDYLLWIFGDIKKQQSQINKSSNITLDSNDFLHLCGTLKNKASFQISLSYFSHLSRRELFVDTNKGTYFLNFISNQLVHSYKKTSKKYSIKDFNYKKSFFLMHKNILKVSKKNYLPDITFNNKVHKILHSL